MGKWRVEGRSSIGLMKQRGLLDRVVDDRLPLVFEPRPTAVELSHHAILVLLRAFTEFDTFVFFDSHLLLSSPTRKRFYPQQPCGQDVVTGVFSSPPGTCLRFYCA